MCARYELDESPADIISRFGLTDPLHAINMSIIRPTDQALIIKASGIATVCGWGFRVNWDNKPMINARSETLRGKPTFKPHLENRCIVPASGYFEWRKESNKKYKNRIFPSDQAIFSMAGLVDGNTFTIITCQPAPEIAHIHNRMPVILTPVAEREWLNGCQSFEHVAHHLVPYDQAPVTAMEEPLPPPRQGDLFQ